MLHRYQFGYVDLPDPATSAEHVLQLDQAPQSVTVRLPGALRSKIDEAAAREGVSLDSWLEQAIASSLSSSRAAAA
jgi:LDH2 family malate/lactate/ureidoglycolate dehydrogenase